MVGAINELDSEHGTLSSLQTTAKSTFVASINEVYDRVGPLASLNTAVKTSSVGAINEVEGELGTIANLTTTVKTSAVAAINELDGEHGDLTTLTTTSKASFVGAINELDSDVGIIANLTTTVKTSAVAAINELDGEHGDLTTLKTTSKSTFVGAINEIFDKHLVGSATFTIGTEETDVITVTVQLKDSAGSNLAFAAGVVAYLSDNSDGSTLISVAHSGGWAITTAGLKIDIQANKAANFITNSTGAFTFTVTESGSKTAYLAVVLPSGKLSVSSAITHAA